MKVFITGATGYIGEALTLELLRRKYAVTALVRTAEKAAKISQMGAQPVIGDLQQAHLIEEYMQGADTVFHLAAYARIWPEKENIFKEINVEGTRTILNAALKNKVKKVVLTSTAGVFGPSGQEPVTEKTARKKRFFSAYEKSKAEAENIAKAYTDKGLHVVIVNPTRVYGPGTTSESNAITTLIKLYLQGKWRIIPGNGKRIGNYCYITDVVEGHLQAMDKGKKGENYLLGGENISYNMLFQQISFISGKDYFLLHLPLPLMLLGSWGLLFWGRITRSKPLITPSWTKKYSFDWCVSSRKAIQELGYGVTPFSEGLKQTISWLRSQ